MAAALLAHEQAMLVIPLVPWVARVGWRGVLATSTVAAAWVLGRVVAFRHGADIPGPGSLAEAVAAIPGVLRTSLEAQLGLGELAGGARVPIVELLAPVAPPVVEAALPERTRPLSFLHVTRMQRTADSARRALTAAHPTLPPGAHVGWWSLPRHPEIAFVGPEALRTWYGDSTLVWMFWDRFAVEEHVPVAVLAFDVGIASPARLMEPAPTPHSARRSSYFGLAARDALAELGAAPAADRAEF